MQTGAPGRGRRDRAAHPNTAMRPRVPAGKRGWVEVA